MAQFCKITLIQNGFEKPINRNCHSDIHIGPKIISGLKSSQ